MLDTAFFTEAGMLFTPHHHPLESALVDNGAMLCVLIGGAFMGTYPVPIKSPTVLKANAHPAVFQFYKSLWVFIGGFLLVLVNHLLGKNPAFVLNWWAILSAQFWIPGGLGTIAAVPRVGVAVTMVLNNGCASLMSFLIGWLIMGERMKEHPLFGGRQFYMAPVYLLFIILGMAVLVAAPHTSKKSVANSPIFKSMTLQSRFEPGSNYGATEELEGGSMPPSRGSRLLRELLPDVSRQTIDGVLLALTAGFMGALQVAVMSFGREHTEKAYHCDLSTATGGCSMALQEKFNTFGSWTASFGIGAITASLLSLAGVLTWQWWQGQPVGEGMAFKEISMHGSLAGNLWVMGALFQTAAVARGGAAAMVPANCTAALITAGLWGVFYYKEVKDWFSAGLWFAAAVWTMAAATALSHERVG